MKLKKPITMAFTILVIFFMCCPMVYGKTPTTDTANVVQRQFSFTTGWEPRMLQLGDTLLVAYFNGNVTLGGINLTNNTIIPPKSIIPGGDRPMLLHDSASKRVLCVFNYGGSGQGSAIGIAWAPDTSWQDPSAWVVQHGLVGPIYRIIGSIGLWEPYIASFDESAGRFLLFYSNQSMYNASHPIDDGGYYVNDTGYKINQQIDVKWLIWNGTGYEASYAGVVSNGIDGKNIHFKDGMASAVLVGQTATSKSFIVTFESWPWNEPGTIASVHITVSVAGGVFSDWRRTVTDDNAGAPFISPWGDGFAVSYRCYQIPEVLGLVGMSSDGSTMSIPLHAPDCPSVWPSLFTLANGSLWVAGGSNTTANLVIVAQIAPSFQWLQPISLLAAACPIVLVGIAGIVMIRVTKKTRVTTE